MKKVLLSFSLLLLTLGAFAQAIPNQNFENWTGTAGSGFEKPQGWKTTNDTINGSGLGGAPSSGVPGGNVFQQMGGANIVTLSSIKLTNRRYVNAVPPIDVKVPGIAISGAGVLSVYPTFSISGGFPFAIRPDTLKGFVTYLHGAGTDTAAVSCLLTKWNTSASHRDTIGYVIRKFTGDIFATYFVDTINYKTGGNPDTCTIVLRSSTSFPAIDTTSTLWIDNLLFYGLDTTQYGTPGIGINEVSEKTTVSLFPNPANNDLSISVSGNSNGMINISNILGQNVMEIKIDRPVAKADISRLPKGVYIYRYNSRDGLVSQTGRLVINR